MSTNISPKCSTMDGYSHLFHEHRRLTLNYDVYDKQRSRMSFSPPGSAKFRDFSMPNGFSRQFNIDSNLSYGLIMKSVDPELLTMARRKVNEAIMNKKIFAIYGPYDKVRQALKYRGWVEKITDEKALTMLYAKLNKIVEGNKDKTLLSPKKEKISSDDNCTVVRTNINEELDSIASLLVLNCVPDFIWSLRLTQVDELTLKPHQMINHFKKAGSFTTKIGLIKSFNYLCWYEKQNDDVFPRSYILSDENEKKAFLNDYYLTACIGLLKLTSKASNTSEQRNGDKIDCEVMMMDENNSKYDNNKVTIIGDSNMNIKPVINYNIKEMGDSKCKIDRRYSEMAIHYCEFYLKYYLNKDLDQKEVVFCSVKRWEEFFDNYHRVTNEGYGIDYTDSIRERSTYLCKELQKIHPQYNLDGSKNIWIVKPGAKSRGRGIFCASKFCDINDVVRTTSETLIVQKYIENPLLVYKTKFDIRQWFMVTDWSPLTIWWYNDSYVRFCSQQFTLNDFNEAVHLSNNSIQYKYQNGTRSKHLPVHNMWDWQSLEKYLEDNGYKNGWKKQILPAMKNIIIDVLLCSQEEIDDRKNSFELYGADFMVTADDLKTWLLEINSSPCMAPSTDITAKLTKSVLEDVIKVLFDYPENVYCDTGQFELLYKQSPFSIPVISSSEKLTIYGTSIKKPQNMFHYSKKESMSPKKNTVQEDSSQLRNKIRQISENFHYIREASKLREFNVQTKSQRLTETRLDKPSINLRNQRLEDYISQVTVRNQRRSRSHNPEVLPRQNFSFVRNSSTKSYLTPLLTQSFEDKAHINVVRSLDPIKQSAGDETHLTSDLQQKQRKLNNRHIRLKALYNENTLTTKLQNWRQMDKNQNQRLHQILKAYLPCMDSVK